MKVNPAFETSIASILVPATILFISILTIACEKQEDILPVGKLIEGFRAEGYPIVETQFDSLTNTYTLTVPADADPADLALEPILASGVTLSPDPSGFTDYTQPVSFELQKKKAASQTIRVKVVRLPVGSSARCLLTRIESMDHPDDYFTFEYNEGALISKIRASSLFSNWGTTEFRYGGMGVGVCEEKDSHFGDSPQQTLVEYDASGKVSKVLVWDWSWNVSTDWLGHGFISFNELNQFTGSPGHLVYHYENSMVTTIEIRDPDTNEWTTIRVEYDGKRHFLSGSRPVRMINYFLDMLGRVNVRPGAERIILDFHMLSSRQNISRFLRDDGEQIIQYTYNKEGFPITNEMERLRFYYANCD